MTTDIATCPIVLLNSVKRLTLCSKEPARRQSRATKVFVLVGLVARTPTYPVAACSCCVSARVPNSEVGWSREIEFVERASGERIICLGRASSHRRQDAHCGRQSHTPGHNSQWFAVPRRASAQTADRTLKSSEGAIFSNGHRILLRRRNAGAQERRNAGKQKRRNAGTQEGVGLQRRLQASGTSAVAGPEPCADERSA